MNVYINWCLCVSVTLSCGHVVHAWRYQHAGSICKYENVNITDLPEHVDWRDEGAVTPIKDQGTYCKFKILIIYIQHNI